MIETILKIVLEQVWPLVGAGVVALALLWARISGKRSERKDVLHEAEKQDYERAAEIRESVDDVDRRAPDADGVRNEKSDPEGFTYRD